RLLRRIGRVTPANMEQIETTLALILGLESTATVPGRRPPGLAPLETLRSQVVAEVHERDRRLQERAAELRAAR
ncbi:MAG: hypothetical protein ACRD0B_07255, partial [Acidimicrobiales bacterium]